MSVIDLDYMARIWRIFGPCGGNAVEAANDK